MRDNNVTDIEEQERNATLRRRHNRYNAIHP